MQWRVIGLVVTGLLALGFGVASLIVWTQTDADTPPQAGTTLTAATPDAVEYGQRVFMEKGCVGCHVVDGIDSGLAIGPNLTLLVRNAGTRVEGMSAEAYVRESILAPQAFVVLGFSQDPMPTLPVSDDEADALVAFLLRED